MEFVIERCIIWFIMPHYDVIKDIKIINDVINAKNRKIATALVWAPFNLVSGIMKTSAFKNLTSSGATTFYGSRRNFPVLLKFWPFRPIKTETFESRCFLRSKIVACTS